MSAAACPEHFTSAATRPGQFASAAAWPGHFTTSAAFPGHFASALSQLPPGQATPRPAARTAPAPIAAPSPPGPPEPTTKPPSAPPPRPEPEHPPQADPKPTPASLRELRAEVHDCKKCKLHAGRQTTVFGEGSPTARVMFIGEAPGAREDQTGRPFVGAAGEQLDRILHGAMGLQRSEVFIANLNKCRPPGNRTPEPDEVAACLPYLKRQVELIEPEVIVCLGRTAAQNLLGTTASTTNLRRKQHEYCGIPVIVTWHPAYLLREPSHKRETWDDIKRVNRLLGLPEQPAPPS